MATSADSSSSSLDKDHEKEHELVAQAGSLPKNVPAPVPTDPLELPYRTLTGNADMGEYTQETATGLRLHQTISRITGKEEEYELVTFTVGDKENPKNWSKAYKWYCTMVVAFTCFAVALNSAVITADLGGVKESFGVSEEVALLTITVRCDRAAQGQVTSAASRLTIHHARLTYCFPRRSARGLFR